LLICPREACDELTMLLIRTCRYWQYEKCPAVQRRLPTSEADVNVPAFSSHTLTLDEMLVL
jgi:hypothetical protein